MKQLIQYLLENLILDFQGDLTLDMVRDFLRDDDSREGRALLAKLVEDRGVSDMMITLADCLQDYLKTGINDETLREQITAIVEERLAGDWADVTGDVVQDELEQHPSVRPEGDPVV